MMRHTPRPQEIYRHFKGNLYQIITVAKHSETGEQLVVYQAMYGEFRIYARPLSLFMERVNRGKYPQAEQEYRFEIAEPSRDAEGAGMAGGMAWSGARHMQSEAAVKGAGYGTDYMSGEKKDAVRNNGMADDSFTGKEEWGCGAEADGRKESRTGSCEEASAGNREEASAGSREEASTGSREEAYADGRGQEAEELHMDPMVLEFLDASTYEKRLNILAGLHHRITDDMINIMAMATDIEVKPGDVEERYAELRNCLMKMERFECNRLR